MKHITAICMLTLAFAAPATATAQDNPLSYHARYAFGAMKLWLVASADKMPAEQYGFKPTDSVRTFGQIIGHAADVQYRFCSVVLGEKNPLPNIEKTRTSKPELITALKEALAYCDRAYDGMTDAASAETVNVGIPMPKLSVLYVNSMHATLHYGNLVTYLRLKGITPPSSDPAYVPTPPKK
jgi:uncharacterized damage-inducible protein DinB